MVKLVVRPPIQEDWTIEKIAREHPPLGWESVFSACIDNLTYISNTLLDQKEAYYPRHSELFRAFDLTPLDKVRVVIIGQDPYHQTLQNGLPRATGLSFSVRKGDAIPSSLSNIYQELHQSINGFSVPNHGDLSYWATQGVLMLNKCLTVAPGKANSHGKFELWMGFVQAVITAIVERKNTPPAIFVCWGQDAQGLLPVIGSKPIILTTSHPSGRSANRGFLGCGHFAEINKILKTQGSEPIDWQV